ncbi:MAG: M17 family peptidase N-terminal domain-containing protein, partial [Nanoarchaeota archaeon]
MEIQIFNKLSYEEHINLTFLLTEESTNQLKRFNAKSEIDKLIKSAILDGDFTGEKDKLILLRTSKGKPKRIILSGLGKEKEVNQETIRRSINTVIKTLKASKLDEFSAFCPDLKNLKDYEVAKSVMEGSILGNYEFIKYKTDKSKIININKLSLIHPKSTELRETIARTKIICDNILWLRDIVNENADAKNPVEM